MPVAQLNGKQEVPEHVQLHLDEIHRTADAAEEAVKANNIELATELKAKLKALFEDTPEEAKTRGLIGSGGNVRVPRKDAPQDVPESLKQINAELKEVSTAYNKAVQDGDHESATELRAKLNALRQKSQEESKITSMAAGYFQLWVEIHNLDSSRLYNDGGWDVEHGWFESEKVADSLGNGDVSYIHMGGAPGGGINCTAYYSYRGSPGYSGSFTWYYYFESDLITTTWGGYSNGRWDSWHTVDGHIVRFYVQQRSMPLSSNSSASLRPRDAFLAFLYITLAAFSFFVRTSSAITAPVRLPASPGYQSRSNACPAKCAASGLNPANWSLYYNFEQLVFCQESLFYSFSFLDPVDDPDQVHRIYTCTSFDPDEGSLPANTSSPSAQLVEAPALVNGTYQIGAWPSAPGSFVSSSLATLTNQIRWYLSNGFGSLNRPTVLFASYAPPRYMNNYISTSNISYSAKVAMQFCQPSQVSHHTFGLIATGNGTFATVQDALKSWSTGECLTLPAVQNVTGTIPLVAPLFTSSTSTNSAKVHKNAASVRGTALAPRATCSTIQVAPGDSCGSLAQRCGITTAQFTQYNPTSNQCSTIQVDEHICCSAGTLLNFAPQPQPNGACATYTVRPNDDCATITATYSIAVADINNFNNNTWAWNGCSLLYPHNIICLSSRHTDPSKRDEYFHAQPVPSQCMLQCMGSSSSGTAATGTNGCISNCGTKIVLSSHPATYRSVAFYDGYNLQRPRLHQGIPNATTIYEFNVFKQIQGAKRILSIGSWGFSTNPSTYTIFREGVTAANRLTMATKIANFIKDNGLDGVNIGWEYPGYEHSLFSLYACLRGHGYISNAEIQEILANSSRLNQNFIDLASSTNILIYDDTQWVGWMSNGIKASRAALYKGLAMGGTADWATDLQEFNNPPFIVSSWGVLINNVKLSRDPYEGDNQTGNWTSLTCMDPAMQDALYMSCSQRWSELDASNAWSDAINVWFNIDQPKMGPSGYSFTLSIMNTFHAGENLDFGRALARAPVIRGLRPRRSIILSRLSTRSVPGISDEWLKTLTNLLGLGITAIAGPSFDGTLEALGEAGADTAKNITYASLAFGAAVASATLPSDAPSKWTAHSQDSFTATLGSVVFGWASLAENQLYTLFNGSEASVTLLGTMIANGNLIECSSGSPLIDCQTNSETNTQIEILINKAFFGFAIPEVWTVSGTAAFVVDSGYPCGTVNPLTQYMTVETQEATYSCSNGKLYYLVYPDGDWQGCPNEDVALTVDMVEPSLPECKPTYFSASPGLSTLGPGSWGNITVSDLIAGPVNTYVANGNANGGSVANPLDQQTLQDLANQDITTPVTSDSQYAAPKSPGPHGRGVTKCSGYTYVDQTTSGSTWISDCQTIIKSIQGTKGEWTTGTGAQRDIASFGTCHFGVDNSGVTGDVTYYTGSQDIVSIITEAISLYAWNGLVGVKGYMECGGDAGSQKVEWGLY
ncbi:glycoside hydrolase, superfamily [Trichoderma arundinaceum]|uniref:Glycoside hydrolase, superfamily n=1 Tax=Trichoderma arundinaceum TaxID=490622 RepID=A0A395NU77_TRIAR|nr:glycoside hydrolase, superfamily [Trichoderma arundinaceum]